jgi:hypothetical protein
LTTTRDRDLVIWTEPAEHFLGEGSDNSLAAASFAKHNSHSASRITSSHGYGVAKTAQSHKSVTSVIVWMHEADARRRVVTHVVKGTIAEPQPDHRATVTYRHVRAALAIDPVRIIPHFALIDEGQQIDRDEFDVTHRTPLID